MDVLKNADRIAIDLQHAGETFIDPTLESFLDRVLYLKELGYNVPDFTIDNIKEEIAEKKGSKL